MKTQQVPIDIVAATIADMNRWQSQFAQELLDDLKREVEGGTIWEDISLLEIIEQKLERYDLVIATPTADRMREVTAQCDQLREALWECFDFIGRAHGGEGMIEEERWALLSNARNDARAALARCEKGQS